jgi:Helix-turn-helix domain
MTNALPSSATHDLSSTLLTAEQAGAYLHVNPRTLANWRVLGRGPRYVRSGSRALYRQADIDAWLDAHTFEHMADERQRRERQTAGGEV